MPLSDVFDHVMQENFSEDLTRYCAKEFLAALQHIHRKGIVHLDMKLENVLIDNDCNLKLCDFGFAQESRGVDSTGLMRRFVGTENYMMPEIWEKVYYRGDESDLFSLGVMIFAMRGKMFPWNKATKDDYYFKMIQNNDE